MEKEITIESLTRELTILSLNKTINDDERFAKILEKGSESLKTFVISNRITDIPSLNKKITSMEKSKPDVDAIIEACTCQRLQKKNNR